MRFFRLLFLIFFAAWLFPAHAASPPTAGSPAPDFVLPDAAGQERRLAEWRSKWLVLYFYPKDDTTGCTTEAKNFRDSANQLRELNAAVVGVSLDDAGSHRAFAERYGLPFPLLVDENGEVARRYGALSDFGLIRFARRYTFLIDPEGRVAKVYLQVDADRHAAEVLADIRALNGR